MSQLSECVARVREAVDLAAPFIKDWVNAKNSWAKDANSEVFLPTAGNSEMSTRYILIDPMLRALGWDLSDPQQCVVDCKLPNGGRPDYVLFGRDRSIAAIIEAKRIDEHTREPEHWEQVYRYGKSEPPDVACVTNGEYWSFWKWAWDSERYVNVDEEDRPLALTWPDRDETADRLCKLLGRKV